MSHVSEYDAFKNNHSKPYVKIARGVDFTPSAISPAEDTTDHITPPTRPVSLEIGKIGVSALREDTEPLAFVNPYEAENRADIAAKLQKITAPYIQAARLEIPNAADNKRGLFGGLKDYYGSTPESTATCVFGGRRIKKVTTFQYELGKDYNQLKSGHTEMQGHQIRTLTYFDKNERMVQVLCNLPKQGSTNEAPEGLEPIAKLRDEIGWKPIQFEIQFILLAEELGAKLSTGGIGSHGSTEDELIYNKMTNSFDFRVNATHDSLSAEEFIELVRAALQFTPLDQH